LGGRDYSIKYIENNNENLEDTEEYNYEADAIIDQSNGYIYFGAARNLPGVKQLYQKQNKGEKLNKNENKNNIMNNNNIINMNKRELLNRVNNGNNEYYAESEGKNEELINSVEQKWNSDQIHHNNSHIEYNAETEMFRSLSSITSNINQFPYILPNKDEIEAQIVVQTKKKLLEEYNLT
jgi:hypothetical protein